MHGNLTRAPPSCNAVVRQKPAGVGLLTSPRRGPCLAMSHVLATRSLIGVPITSNGAPGPHVSRIASHVSHYLLRVVRAFCHSITRAGATGGYEATKRSNLPTCREKLRMDIALVHSPAIRISELSLGANHLSPYGRRSRFPNRQKIAEHAAPINLISISKVLPRATLFANP